MRTSFQSASSSSATIWASAVPTPWPISAFVMCTVMIPSGVIVRVAFGSNAAAADASRRSEEHTSELQSRLHLVCRLLLEKKKDNSATHGRHPKTPHWDDLLR